MTWATILPLIITYGPEFVAKIWALFSANKPPTDADWAALLELTKKNARSQMALAFARNGTDPNSPAAIALLAMAG